MSHDFDAMDAYLNRAYWEGQDALHKHRNVPLPENFPAWLEQAKRTINREITRLPADLQLEFQRLMDNKIETLETYHRRGDEDYLKVLIVGLKENLEIIRQNTVIAMGEDFSQEQSKKGQKGAAKRWDKGEAREAVTEIIKRLAERRDELGDYEPPSELWPILFSSMDDAGVSPVDLGDRYDYEAGDTITYSAFRKQIQRLRK